MTLSDEWLAEHAVRINQMGMLIDAGGPQTLANIIGALMLTDEQWNATLDGTADYDAINEEVARRQREVGIDVDIVE